MKHLRKYNENENKDKDNILDIILDCFASVFDLADSYKIFESRVEELETEIDYDCYDVDIEHLYYGHDISEIDFNKYVDILNEIRESVEKLKEIYNYKVQFAETNTSKIRVKIYK